MHPLNILLADDTVSVGEFVSGYLRDAGHRVTLVQSGEAAVLAYQAQTFDLVLMDVIMPGIGGLEAVKQLKAIPTPNWVPVIIITALGNDEDVLSGFLAGADDYILKPLKPITLDIRIRSMMRIAAIQRTATAVVDNVIEAVIRINRVGRIMQFNRAAERIFGFAAAEVVGSNVSLLMPSPDREQHDDYIANYIATGQAKVIGIGREVTGLRKNGEAFPMHLGITEAATPDGKFFIGLVRDLTDEVKLRARNEFLANHDGLTGLPNRGACWRHLAQRLNLRTAQQGTAECSVFFCDLDGFKAINDRHGHAAGDAVLRQIGNRLQEIMFVRDFVARIGGDEFLAVVDGSLNDSAAQDIAMRIVETVSQPIETEWGTLQVGVSVGIAHSRNQGASIESLVDAADHAMYQIKHGGKIANEPLEILNY